MPTKATTVYEDVARLYECRLCPGYIKPPIFQCHTGHLICSNCRPEVICPECIRPFGIIRNSAMEQVASVSCEWEGSFEVVLPHLMMSRGSIPPHEDEDIKFPLPDINVQGPMNWFCILSHFGHHFIMVLSKLDPTGHQNFDVYELNNIIQCNIHRVAVTYKSVDTVVEADEAVNYPTEFFNSLDLPQQRVAGYS
ncbi:hypothetical protein B7P43_G09255 [Cryptotermes secundus]|uniref:E3 ubiquitin-protein ligase Sina-like RING finger domain-containing protein n=1 Tax=Cryptotermes secundus TaxID=105785 RepID=A0A2J7QTA9_9NEOP|nr:hypothetical protein B7P43_G09255 [Cryptotermes secundus]